MSDCKWVIHIEKKEGYIPYLPSSILFTFFNWANVRVLRKCKESKAQDVKLCIFAAVVGKLKEVDWFLPGGGAVCPRCLVRLRWSEWNEKRWKCKKEIKSKLSSVIFISTVDGLVNIGKFIESRISLLLNGGGNLRQSTCHFTIHWRNFNGFFFNKNPFECSSFLLVIHSTKSCSPKPYPRLFPFRDSSHWIEHLQKDPSDMIHWQWQQIENLGALLRQLSSCSLLFLNYMVLWRFSITNIIINIYFPMSACLPVFHGWASK